MSLDRSYFFEQAVTLMMGLVQDTGPFKQYNFYHFPFLLPEPPSLYKYGYALFIANTAESIIPVFLACSFIFPRGILISITFYVSETQKCSYTFK